MPGFPIDSHKYKYSKNVFKCSINTNTHVFDPNPLVCILYFVALLNVIVYLIVISIYLSLDARAVNLHKLILPSLKLLVVCTCTFFFCGAVAQPV